MAILYAGITGRDRIVRLASDGGNDVLARARGLLDELITGYGGELLAAAGEDEFCAAFPSVVAAATCALDLHRQWTPAFAHVSSALRPNFRIGVDGVGETTGKGDALQDCLARARTLQALARPGTILVSGAVIDQIRPHLHYAYRERGEYSVQGTADRIRGLQIKPPPKGPVRRGRIERWRRPVAAGVAALAVLALLAWGAQSFMDRGASDPSGLAALAPEGAAPSSPAEADPEAMGEGAQGGPPDASVSASEALDRASPPADDAGPEAEQVAGTPGDEETQLARLSRPDSTEPVTDADAPDGPPTLAVLPFGGLGEASRPDYFSEGFTEVLIHHLTRFPHAVVLASESTRPHVNGVSPREVARDLDVRYVLRGAAGRRGDVLVVSAQLFDALTGEALWPERYEVTTNDPAAVLRPLAQRVLVSLEGRDPSLVSAGVAPSPAPARGSTQSLEAFDYALQWRDAFQRSTPESNLRAREAAIRALELDPGFAAAYAYVAWTLLADYWHGWAADPVGTLEQARRWAEQAVAVDRSEFNAHWALGDVHQALNDYDRALTAYETALALNPNVADLLQDVGTWILPVVGRPAEGLNLALKAMRLNPKHDEAWHGNLALNYYLLERYEDAVDAVGRMREPRLDHRLYLAASYAQLGMAGRAEAEIARALDDRPDLTVPRFLASLPFQRQRDLDLLGQGLTKAGLNA